MRVARADRSVLGQWWLSVDRGLIVAILALMGAGLVIALASSPAVAVKKGLPALYFAERHMVFAGVGLMLMLAVSLLSPRTLRRLALWTFIVSIAAMAAVLWTGDEINGARRWLRIAGFSLQPSEFGKPAFVVLVAWAFAESERRPDMPALPIATGLLVIFATLLVLQPDIGQTLLVAAVWVTLFLLSGRGIAAVLAVSSAGAAGLIAAYVTFSHVRFRIDRFMSPPTGGKSQTERAFQSFAEGGWFGRGPGEGTMKTILPDAHTDFVFAVVAEEFGAIVCVLLVMLLAAIVLRPILRAANEDDAFIRNSAIGLALLLGLQSLINLGSNVGSLPAKGMTLPFVSVGGSSMLAVSLTAGMLLGISRRRNTLGLLHARSRARVAAHEGAS